MNGLLFLLYGTEILGAVLCGTETSTMPSKMNDNHTSTTAADPSNSYTSLRSTSELSSSVTIRPSISPVQFSISPRTSLTPGPQPTTAVGPPGSQLWWGNIVGLRPPVLMVTGGLIIACTILLLSTSLLAWKVCQLSSRIKALRGITDEIVDAEPLMESEKKNTSQPETEPKETSMKMTEFSQTVEETNNGTTVEEGGAVNENNNKEVGDADKSEATSAAPVAIAENVSSSKLQEGATNSQPTTAVEASNSEGTEEPTDVV